MSIETSLRFYLTEAAKNAGAKFESPREGDAGFDLRAAESLVIEPGAQALISTGLHLAIPIGWVGIVKDRSSMASKRVYTHAGVIDASYRGEVKVLASNHGSAGYQIQAGDKVAQLLVVQVLTAASPVADLASLGDTSRGAGGFGSTGR